jgi:hypothetical protein
MRKVIIQLIFICCTTVLTGCLLQKTKKLSFENPFNFISTKCNIGDEFEIGIPIPRSPKVKGRGNVFYHWSFYQYNFNKGKWESVIKPELSLGRRLQGGGFNFYRNNLDSLKSKSIKIKILKTGLFLVKTRLKIFDASTEEYIYVTEFSSIFDSQ